MLSILKNKTYRRLFQAQLVALFGNGLATLALGLLAFEMAGASAGAVLGTALAVRMIANVVIAPIATAFATRLARRTLLIALDIIRAPIALLFPFATEIWQIYVLIFLLQSASAAFTPAFQATIPDILPEERDYTLALSLSRLAFSLEAVLSPVLAAVLLSFASFHGLFSATVVGFIVSAALLFSVALPDPKSQVHRSVYQRTTRGLRIYFATPRLRGMLAVGMAVAFCGSMVIVNAVVFSQQKFGLDNQSTAIALAFFGGGSMLGALVVPALLQRFSDRTVMLSASTAFAVGIISTSALSSYGWLLGLWPVLGVCYASVLTPQGRLLKRSSHPEDRQALFAAQFALSHSCWMIAYPLAGWSGSAVGLSLTGAVLGGLSLGSILIACVIWPKSDPEAVFHSHHDLAEGHPHLSGVNGSKGHTHPFVIDDIHKAWPMAQDDWSRSANGI